MKIIICLIFCYFMKVIYGYFDIPQISLHSESELSYPRFADLISVNDKNDVESDKNMGYNYKLSIYIVKESDSSEDKITDIKTIISFSKKSINLLKKKKVTKKIPLTDFQFWDGKVLFKNMAELSKITTQVYKDILAKFQPRIEQIITTIGKEKFDKYCSLTIRRKLRVADDYSKGDFTLFLLFCLNENETPSIQIKFREEFVNLYTNAMLNTDKFLTLQNYLPKQTLNLQFYDPNEELSETQTEISISHISFNPEGLLISAVQSSDSNKLKSSLRFDQIINCRGIDPNVVKSSMDKKIASRFKSNECCIAYDINWNSKPVSELFCSIYKESHNCKVDIKIFQSTIYSYCLKNNIVKLQEEISKNADLRSADLSLTKRVRLIEISKEITKNDLLKYLKSDVQLSKFLVEEKPLAPNHWHTLLEGMKDLDDSFKLKSKASFNNNITKFVNNDTQSIINFDSDASDANPNSGNKAITHTKYLINLYLKELAILNKEKGMKNTTLGQKNTTIDNKYNNGTLKDMNQTQIKDLYDTLENLTKKLKAHLGNMKLTENEIQLISDLVINNTKLIKDLNKLDGLFPIGVFDNMKEDALYQIQRLIKSKKEFKIKSNPHMFSGNPCSQNGSQSNSQNSSQNNNPDSSQNNNNNNNNNNANSSNNTVPFTNDTSIVPSKNESQLLPVDEPTNYNSDDDFNTLKSCEPEEHLKNITFFKNRNINIPLESELTNETLAIILPSNKTIEDIQSPMQKMEENKIMMGIFPNNIANITTNDIDKKPKRNSGGGKLLAIEYKNLPKLNAEKVGNSETNRTINKINPPDEIGLDKSYTNHTVSFVNTNKVRNNHIDHHEDKNQIKNGTQKINKLKHENDNLEKSESKAKNKLRKI